VDSAFDGRSVRALGTEQETVRLPLSRGV